MYQLIQSRALALLSLVTGHYTCLQVLYAEVCILLFPHAGGGEHVLIALAVSFYCEAGNFAQVEMFQHVKLVWWDKGKRICIM